MHSVSSFKPNLLDHPEEVVTHHRLREKRSDLDLHYIPFSQHWVGPTRSVSVGCTLAVPPPI